MRSELRFAWVRDLPIAIVKDPTGTLFVPLAGPWERQLQRCNWPEEAADDPDASRVASEPSEPV